MKWTVGHLSLQSSRVANDQQRLPTSCARILPCGRAAFSSALDETGSTSACSTWSESFCRCRSAADPPDADVRRGTETIRELRTVMLDVTDVHELMLQL